MKLKDAYDIKELTEVLKAEGLDLAEEGAKIALNAVIEWIASSAAKSKTPYDDIVATILPLIKGEVLKQIDKIDGEIEG